MLEDKFEFFYKPKTRQEIIGNKEIVPASKNELAEKIRSLEESQVIIMDYTIDDKSQKLIGERYHSPENFLKHGNFLVVDSTDSMWKSRRERFNELKSKKNADRNYFAEYAGITWKRKGVDERSRIVHLTDCVEGVMIYYYLVNSENFSEIFKYSHEAKPSRRGVEEGANYAIEMISRSGKRKPNVAVTLRHVPFTRKGNPSNVAAGLDALCDCWYFRNHNLVYQDDRTGRKSPLFFDMHLVAAYLMIIDKDQKEYRNFVEQMKRNGKVIKHKACVSMQENPFPLPNQTTLNDYLKFERQVMIRDFARDEEGNIKLRKDGKPRTELRKVNRAEKELFLWNYIAEFGADTFFATKKLRDYEISIRKP